MRLLQALAVSALALLGCAAGAAGPAGTTGIEIRARPVDISPGELHGLRLRSAVSLSADHPEFGGFSGLQVDGGRMVAVTDQGWWLLADLFEDPDGLRPVNAGFAPMSGEGGETLDGKAGGDAEALTMRDGRLYVAFERDHRIMAHLGQGRLGETIRNRRFERLDGNKGLEALATHPEGWLIAIAEDEARTGFPMFVIRYSGAIEEGRLPQEGRHQPTGADVGPDGRLYLLRRHYAPLLGVSIRVERYELAETGFPRPETRQVLAAYESGSGIDNMEGISVWRDGVGVTHLTLISDDNFNFVQRTLLMDFEVLE